VFLPASYLRRYDAASQASVEGKFSLLYPTNRETSLLLDRNLADLLKQGLDNFVVERTRLARESYLVGIGPFKNAFGKTAGVLLSQRNLTLLYDALWRGVVVSLAGFLVILMVGNTLLYLSILKSLTLFESLHEHIRKVTRTWDITSRLRVDTRDDMRQAGKLSQPFKPLQNAGKFSGTGIGLATVQKIVQRHGRRVWAKGKEGAGSTFYFTLS
jgi:hypothetical protein